MGWHAYPTTAGEPSRCHLCTAAVALERFQCTSKVTRPTDQNIHCMAFMCHQIHCLSHSAEAILLHSSPDTLLQSKSGVRAFACYYGMPPTSRMCLSLSAAGPLLSEHHGTTPSFKMQCSSPSEGAMAATSVAMRALSGWQSHATYLSHVPLIFCCHGHHALRLGISRGECIPGVGAGGLSLQRQQGHSIQHTHPDVSPCTVQG
jgi:hypothetical protein